MSRLNEILFVWKLKQFLVLVFILFIQHFFYSQNKNSKIIVDVKTKQPIDYVYVNSDDNRLHLMSNNEGRLILTSDSKTRSFTFYKIGYYPKTLSVKELAVTDSIFLKEKSIDLSEVSITAKTLETIVKDKRYYVNDYLVLPNRDFILITSKINIKAFDLLYYKKDRGITCRKQILKEEGEHLVLDCFKNIHLVTEKYARQLIFNSDSTFDFLFKYTRAKFDSTLANCVLKIDTELVFKLYPPPLNVKGPIFNYKKNSPHLAYLKVHKKQRQLFYSLSFNKKMMQMYDYEEADQNSKIAAFTLLGGHLESAEAYESQKELFFRKIAKPIYAPIFLIKDTVVIFNFEENRIVFLNKAGTVFKEVALKDKDISTLHDFEIIFDSAKGKFYFMTKEFDKSTLSRLDIYSGSVKEKIHLERVFAKKIQVFDDKIYYLVKEKEWDDTCYLYQQNL